MLGFDAIGLRPIASGPRAAGSSYTLVGLAGAYALTGVAARFSARRNPGKRPSWGWQPAH